MAGVSIQGWLLPGQAAQRLGVPPSRLRKLVEAGEIVETRDAVGRRRYDPHPVEQLRARQRATVAQIVSAARAPRGAAAVDGKAHAKAFRLFAEGRSPRDVVMECELPAGVVLELRRQFADMGHDFVLTAPELEELREILDWRGNATATSLFHAVRARIRSAFERGQAVAAEPENHTTEEPSSVKSDRGAAGQSQGVVDEIEDPVRGDAEDGQAVKPRLRRA